MEKMQMNLFKNYLIVIVRNMFVINGFSFVLETLREAIKLKLLNIFHSFFKKRKKRKTSRGTSVHLVN